MLADLKQVVSQVFKRDGLVLVILEQEDQVGDRNGCTHRQG